MTDLVCIFKYQSACQATDRFTAPATLLHSCTADIASVPERGGGGGERGRGGGGAAGPGQGRRAERETGSDILPYIAQ